MPPFKSLVAASLLAAAVSTAHAQGSGVFRIDTVVAGNRTSVSYATVEDAFDALKGGNLSSINPAYTGTQAVAVTIDYRGTTLQATYAGAGTSLLTLNIPSIGLVQNFDAGSRDATQRQLKDYFKQNSDNVLGRLSKDLARNSAVDPIAGNPNSLMSQLVAQDFRNGFFEPASTAKEGGTINLVGAGVGYGQYRQDGVTSRAYSVPLSYAIRSDDDPRRQFVFRLPLAMIDADGSKSYQLGVGASLGLPVTERWTLTPAANYAAAGSRDLGSLAGMASASLTSSYVIPFGGFDLAIGNMAGYYKALRIKSGDYGYDPGIANTVLRNGVMLSQPVTLAGRNLAVEYSVVDTHFLGDDLYAKHYDEVGVALAKAKRDASGSDLRAGASFLFSPKVKGFNVGVRYRF